MNADIHQSIAILPNQLDWKKQGQQDKAQLEQLDWETAFIRLQAGATLVTETELSEGEEYLVLEGSIDSNTEIYTKSDYLRFPVGKIRSLKAGDKGAVIFQKLRHFNDTDQEYLALNTVNQEWRQGMVEGLSVMPLYHHGHENIALVKWGPNTQFNPHVHPGGEEIVVLDGTFHDEHGSYPTGAWLRNRPYSKHTPHTEQDGALIYVKTGHLPPLVH